jgi:uncharacterized membrane protein
MLAAIIIGLALSGIALLMLAVSFWHEKQTRMTELCLGVGALAVIVAAIQTMEYIGCSPLSSSLP